MFDLLPVFLQGCRESVLWLAVHHRQKKALEFFSREVSPAGTGMGTKKKVSGLLSALASC